MNQDPVERFVASMVMDYEKWHDGIGYDLDALDDMTPDQKAVVEQKLLAKLDDWRDLEALDRIGTPSSLAGIALARQSPISELRLAAQSYGQEPSSDTRDAAIVHGLQHDDVYGGLTRALDLAADHPTPEVVKALLICARDRGGPAAYHAAAVLYFLKGKIESHHGMEKREFFLRFVAVGTDDHRSAFGDLCRELGFDPSSLAPT